VRVELKNSGCCDAVLSLRTDTFRNSDLTVEADGVVFLIAPETYQVTGDVVISYVDKAGKKGFMVTSSQQVSEWDGFAVTGIEI
jgi:Fe-S cluster assembly iron-binding protein IscA